MGREPKLFGRRKQRCGLLLSVLLQLVTVSDVISFSDAQTPTFQQRPGLTVDMYLDHLLPVVCRHKYFFKNCSLSTQLTAIDQKPQKNHEKGDITRHHSA